MNTTDISTLIVSIITSFGGAVLTIITATVGLGVAYLAFRFGWKMLQRILGNSNDSFDYEDSEMDRQSQDDEFILSKNGVANMRAGGSSDAEIARMRGQAMNRRDGIDLS